MSSSITNEFIELAARREYEKANSLIKSLRLQSNEYSQSVLEYVINKVIKETTCPLLNEDLEQFIPIIKNVEQCTSDQEIKFQYKYTVAEYREELIRISDELDAVFNIPREYDF